MQMPVREAIYAVKNMMAKGVRLWGTLMRDSSVELPTTVALVATVTFAKAADYRG
ncbi:hypothetical protein MES5069_430035 [Mesorhizobium escarrei]|uniref:Transposase n=1 Tax=Mesorhizobium escarrei TaxID=666018 RepID=A0ABM9E669_9HYPH|nr:hypothetical protein MES5069_430035 [Mesorhizobium escarrei]